MPAEHPDEGAQTPGLTRAAAERAARAEASGAGPRGAGRSGGTAIHAMLERVDFATGHLPEIAELEALGRASRRGAQEMVAEFTRSAIFRRLAAAGEVRREQRFVLALDPELPLITGAFDALASEPGDALLVVDYKSDHLGTSEPAQLVDERYALQQAIYALAALRTGAARVEVVHVFLERPGAPCARVLTRGEMPALERLISDAARRISRREFPVAEQPWAGVCGGCPAREGLCSWPSPLTRRPAVDRLL